MASDNLKVTMLVQIAGDRYTDTGQKKPDGSTIYEQHSWPKPGDSITLPRSVAMDLIHNEMAYPAKLGRRPKDRAEAFIAAGAPQSAASE